MPLNVGDRLGHYEITGELGAGGMGIVLRAHDTKLDRDVAVKVLPDRLANERGALRRFQQEARAVAALNHPNVVTIHAVDERDGVHFLAMELVEGQGLSELIGGEPLSLARFFEVSVPLADALATAHDEGITHRDLKPANVMITAAGRVKVLDFGLAKFVGLRHEQEATLSAPLTERGAAVGTFPYMSPEQLEAKAVDHRSDIFSLGVVMYELIAGRRPFVGDSGPSLASAILRDDPPSLAVARAGLPAALVHLIERCLEKAPDRRYQSADELRRELEAVRRDHESGVTVGAAPPTRDKAIAVLPFTNMSADPENEFFSDGVSEEIINALGRIEHLHVAARTSAFSFKGQQVNLRDIGRQLNVNTVVEGSVRRAGTRLRITAQLVNVADGYQIWSERYDRELEDVFAIQDEIARTIVERLKVALTGDVAGQGPLVKAATANSEAYELYLRGRALLYQRGLSVPQALECFKQAVALDAEYAQAWTGLADAHTVLGQYGFVHPAKTMPQAKDAALRAVALDDTLGEAHGALGGALLLHDWDADAAERALERAVALNPGHIQARGWYALFLLSWVRGRFDEAVPHTTQIVRQDPLSTGYAAGVHTLALAYANRTDEAVDHGTAVIDRDATSYLALFALQQAYVVASRFAEAIDVSRLALDVSGRHQWALASLAHAYARKGHVREARAVYEEMVARSSREHMQPSVVAVAAAAAGLEREAVALIDEALAQRDPAMINTIKHFPAYEPVRQALRNAGKLDDTLVTRLRIGAL